MRRAATLAYISIDGWPNQGWWIRIGIHTYLDDWELHKEDEGWGFKIVNQSRIVMIHWEGSYFQDYLTGLKIQSKVAIGMSNEIWKGDEELRRKENINKWWAGEIDRRKPIGYIIVWDITLETRSSIKTSKRAWIKQGPHPSFPGRPQHLPSLILARLLSKHFRGGQ